MGMTCGVEGKKASINNVERVTCRYVLYLQVGMYVILRLDTMKTFDLIHVPSPQYPRDFTSFHALATNTLLSAICFFVQGVFLAASASWDWRAVVTSSTSCKAM